MTLVRSSVERGYSDGWYMKRLLLLELLGTHVVHAPEGQYVKIPQRKV